MKKSKQHAVCNKLVHLLLVCVFALPCNALELAQNVQFKRLGLDQGLSQESVYQIIQDDHGFIWFATQEGLNRYDGHEFVTYLHNPNRKTSISHDWIWAMHQSNDGSLWVGTDGGGLNRLQKNGIDFDQFKSDPNDSTSLSNDKVRAIAEDKQGRLWIGTDHGLNLFDNKEQNFQHFLSDKQNPLSLSNNKIRAMAFEQHGSLWIGTDGGGLNHMDIERKTVRHIRHDPQENNSLSSDRVRSLYESTDGILWVGTYDAGLNRYNPRTGHVKRYQVGSGHGLESNFIRDMIQDHRGVLWLATDNGLYEYRSESDTFVMYQNDTADNKSLNNNRVISLFQDAGNVLWVGTYSGINLWNYQTTAFELFRQSATKKHALKSNTILSFAQSDTDTYWVGTYAGLHKYSPQKAEFEVIGKQQGLPDERITALAVQQNFLWVGSFKSGLTRYDLSNNTMKIYSPDPTRENWFHKGGITSLDVDNQGHLWVANFGGGLYRYNPEQDNFIAYRQQDNEVNSLPSNRVIKVHASDNGEIWVSMLGQGIARLNPETGKITRYINQPNNPSSLANNVNWVIMEDKQANIWIGSQGGGLSLLSAKERRSNNPKFEHITRVQGLTSNVIYGIEEGDKGELWLSSNRGITRFSPDDKSMLHYDINHGLQAYEFQSGAHFKGSDGKMFFGGANGFNAFYPTEIQRNRHPPQVALTKIFKINQPLESESTPFTLDELTLTAKDYLVSFEFAALDFSAAQDNQYKYKLDGYDKDWLNNRKVRRVSYTNLPSGKYTFRVLGANNDGNWSSTGIALPLTVLPPWYMTNYAYFSYVALFMFFLFLLYRLHRGKLAKEAEQSLLLKRQVAERTIELEKKTKQITQRNNELKGVNLQLAEASVIDIHTGLHNRRFVNDYMDKLSLNLERRFEKMSLSEILASNRPVFFLLLDIDNFKELNESHGRIAGDQVLLSVARLLTKQCRGADVLSRWDNDAFIVAGETDDVDAILKLAKRLISSVAESKIVLDESTIQISCSVGVTYYPFSVSQPTIFNWEQVVFMAERAARLSREKATGSWACIRAGQLGLARSDFKKILLDPVSMTKNKAIHLIMESNDENDNVDASISEKSNANI